MCFWCVVVVSVEEENEFSAAHASFYWREKEGKGRNERGDGLEKKEWGGLAFKRATKDI